MNIVQGVVLKHSLKQIVNYMLQDLEHLIQLVNKRPFFCVCLTLNKENIFHFHCELESIFSVMINLNTVIGIFNIYFCKIAELDFKMILRKQVY